MTATTTNGCGALAWRTGATTGATRGVATTPARRDVDRAVDDGGDVARRAMRRGMDRTRGHHARSDDPGRHDGADLQRDAGCRGGAGAGGQVDDARGLQPAGTAREPLRDRVRRERGEAMARRRSARCTSWRTAPSVRPIVKAISVRVRPCRAVPTKASRWRSGRRDTSTKAVSARMCWSVVSAPEAASATSSREASSGARVPAWIAALRTIWCSQPPKVPHLGARWQHSERPEERLLHDVLGTPVRVQLARERQQRAPVALDDGSERRVVTTAGQCHEALVGLRPQKQIRESRTHTSYRTPHRRQRLP